RRFLSFRSLLSFPPGCGPPTVGQPEIHCEASAGQAQYEMLISSVVREVVTMPASDLAFVRTKLARGSLPRQKPDAQGPGRGTRHPCAVCDRSVEFHHFEIEAEFRDRPSLHFHRECFVVWDAERQSERARDAALCAASSQADGGRAESPGRDAGKALIR